MSTPHADDRRPRTAAPASEGLPTAGAAAPPGTAAGLEIACPVCTTFNAPLFRYCPECGHALRTARRREPGPVQPAAPPLGARWRGSLFWLGGGVETGPAGGGRVAHRGWALAAAPPRAPAAPRSGAAG